MKKFQRVVKNDEFTEIIKNSRFVKTPAFTLYYRPKKQERPRVGISVPKKIGNAVVRGKIRRQLRAIVDQIYDFEESFDTILIVRPAWLKGTFPEWKEMLYKAKEKAGQKLSRENDRSLNEKNNT